MTRTRIALTLLAMGTLIVTLGVANTSFAGSDRDGRGHRGRHHRPPGKFIEKNADRLGLEAEQTDQIRALFEESYAESEELHTKLRAARKELRGLLTEDLPDRAQVMKQVKRIGKLETKSQQHRLATMLDVRNMLSEKQRQELVEIRREKRERRGKHGKRDKDGHCEDCERCKDH